MRFGVNCRRGPGSRQDHWLARPGAQIRWSDEGEGPAILLLHGWALDRTLFDRIGAELDGTLRLLRLDRRGYGESTGEPMLEADVEDSLALLDAAGVERCAVLGMSQGARVAAALARQAPDRISRVLLDGAPALRGLAEEMHEPELPLERYRQLAATDLAALRMELARHPLLQLANPDDVAAAALLAGQIERYPAADLRIVRPPSPRDTSLPAAFGQPVLVLNGTLDSAARLRIGDRLAEVLPAATRCLIDGAGHLACLDAPVAYAGAIRRSLTG